MKIDELFGLAGRVALVTGGGRGIGKTIAEALLEAGARVAITGRRSEFLDAAVSDFAAKGLECLPLVADVTSDEGVSTSVETVSRELGEIDILINNAGQTWGQAVEDLPLHRWRQILEVNLTGMFQLS